VVSTIYGDGFVADRFACPAWHEREVAKDAASLSDAANEQEIRRRAEEDAGVRTRPARKEIAALATNLTELELGALVSSLIGAVAKCGWSHTTTGKTVTEYLLDVQEAIDRGCE
jgi:hypothetical protein